MIEKVLEMFLVAILWKPSQLFRPILNYVSNIENALSIQCWFQSKEKVKISWSHIKGEWRMLECRHIILCQEILDQNRPVCWSIVLKKTPVVGSSFLGAFPSDRIAKVTNQLTRQKLP